MHGAYQNVMGCLPSQKRALIPGRRLGNRSILLRLLQSFGAAACCTNLMLFRARLATVIVTTTTTRISFCTSSSGSNNSGSIRLPTSLLDVYDETTEPLMPDFGGLEVIADKRLGINRRVIDENKDLQRYEKEQEQYHWSVSTTEGNDKGPFNVDDVDYDDATADVCLQPAWTYHPHSNCNAVHEHTNTKQLHLLGSGFSRHAWLLQQDDERTRSDAAVLKQQRLDRPFSRARHFKTQLESLVQQHVGTTYATAIYGHCAFTVVSEAAVQIAETVILPTGGDNKSTRNSFQREPGRISRDAIAAMLSSNTTQLLHFNNLTATQKLDMALQISESIAMLHGATSGPVVSQDVSLNQWLRRTADGTILLNDFDQVVVLRRNMTSLSLLRAASADGAGDNENSNYCKYTTSFTGSMHAPEQLRGETLDESADVWKVCGIIFTILTGLHPYYSAPTKRDMLRHIRRGQAPALDLRLYNQSCPIESRLAELLPHCYQGNPEERANIFAVVGHLRETKRLHYLHDPNGL